jgi:hypothetical protein
MKTPSADMSPGLQGFLINFELSNLLTEVVTSPHLTPPLRSSPHLA